MTLSTFSRVLGLTGALALGPAWADPAPPAAACALPESEQHPLLGREERLRRFENLPEACLKTLVMDCSSAASQTMLDAGTAASCSIGYEALLRRGFGGNFQAMLAWWRSQRAAPQVN